MRNSPISVIIVVAVAATAGATVISRNINPKFCFNAFVSKKCYKNKNKEKAISGIACFSKGKRIIPIIAWKIMSLGIGALALGGPVIPSPVR